MEITAEFAVLLVVIFLVSLAMSRILAEWFQWR